MYDNPGKTFFSKHAKITGFRSDSLEKVYRLLAVLGRVQDIQGLSGSLALKGGTALQGGVFGFRRLSVDADLNYVGSIEKEKMKQDREEIRRKMLMLLRDMEYRIDEPNKKYAEERFDAHYVNSNGGLDRIKVEINYLERLPVCGTCKIGVKPLFDDFDGLKILSYRPEELFAGKMRALIVRSTPRDIFDASLIAHHLHSTDEILFRRTSLFYLAMHDDARNLTTNAIRDVRDIDFRDHLIPMLSARETVENEKMKGDALALADSLLSLSSSETEFFDALYLRKTMDQRVLFEGSPVSQDLADHPAVKWRLQQMTSNPRSGHARD